ncbi:hypothetical protein DSO57_1033540 [Entomophthora muscae]|uniref:Uncharacterized protein n=2 Tax=Entomophthora muscae TaxID=34485 RepID=A0ACC2SNZ1_9FUNG|nr:hypothetical protein DSO57_1037081 [Entomophthora muscae]KAJ9067968.1 hypothetical protein DSO57_1033540 [Entomophthora muscae]
MATVDISTIVSLAFTEINLVLANMLHSLGVQPGLAHSFALPKIISVLAYFHTDKFEKESKYDLAGGKPSTMMA